MKQVKVQASFLQWPQPLLNLIVLVKTRFISISICLFNLYGLLALALSHSLNCELLRLKCTI